MQITDLMALTKKYHSSLDFQFNKEKEGKKEGKKGEREIK